MEPEDRAQQQGTLSPSLESIYASSEQPDMNGLTRGQQLAQTSMILGILSLFVVGVILGPLAISKANKAERQFQTSATVGKVTGWVGTVLGAKRGWLVILSTIDRFWDIALQRTHGWRWGSTCQ